MKEQEEKLYKLTKNQLLDLISICDNILNEATRVKHLCVKGIHNKDSYDLILNCMSLSKDILHTTSYLSRLPEFDTHRVSELDDLISHCENNINNILLKMIKD